MSQIADVTSKAYINSLIAQLVSRHMYKHALTNLINKIDSDLLILFEANYTLIN